jgi:gas vesicle protein
LTGAIVFVPSALILAPSSSKEFINLLKQALQRRRKKVAEEPTPS